MKLARYVGDGRIKIRDEPPPGCPPGGLLVQTEASGLCSGELMAWYMDQKIPHVLGHEAAGIVIESQDARFPVGSRVAPHHHGPCLECDLCRTGRPVHCAQWKRTRLLPGGMAEVFAVGAENLTDCARVDDLDPRAAALMEPLGCVAKSILRGRQSALEGGHIAVIGLGVMGLMHALVETNLRTPSPLGRRGGDHLGDESLSPLSTRGEGAGEKIDADSLTAYDLNPGRIEHARSLGINAQLPENPTPADLIYVCPGTAPAIDFAVELAAPGATIVLFSPLGPPGTLTLPFDQAYFRDLNLVMSYSCGPEDTRRAIDWLRHGWVRPDQVVSDFIGIDELPAAYGKMKQGQILKPMVLFGGERSPSSSVV